MRYRSGFLVFLLALTLISYGCGSGGGGAPAEYGGDTPIEDVGPNTARVSLTLDYPDSAEASAATLSPLTTHIKVDAKQWLADDLNKLSVVNTDKVLVVVSGGTTVNLELLPTWTRICASQWKGDPNNFVTSTLLETTCTFGELVEGNNPISLTMIRGEWTLSVPFDDVQAVSLTRTATQGSIDGVDVYDGIPENINLQDIPAQAYNNWGSVYGAMFKKFGSYQMLPSSHGYYQNSFGPTEPNLPFLFFGSGEAPLSRTVGFAIGGVPNATDPATGLLNVKKDTIAFSVYESDYPVPGGSCVYMRYNYRCHKPILFTSDVSAKVEELVGGSLINTTAAVLDGCQVTITGGNVINACAFSDIDVVRVPYSPIGLPPTSYRYKVTGSSITKGANICYKDGGNEAVKDSFGDTICTSREYSSWSSITKVCNAPGMTWNSTYARCEQSLESACIDLGGTYDAVTTYCTLEGSVYSGSAICSNNPYYYSYYTATPSPICYSSSNYYWQYTYNYNCWNGGTYNTDTNRCEATLEEACLGYVAEPGESYDAATETCVSTDTNPAYFDVLNVTPVTLTGVGTLPSSIGFGP